MSDYIVVNLKDFIINKGEEFTKKEIRKFDCKYNDDVNDFIHNKAIEFSKRGFASTYLIYCSYKEELVLLGYFSIAMKLIDVYDLKSMSSNIKGKIKPFCKYDDKLKKHTLPVHLIGQISKNYNVDEKATDLISGREILQIACNNIKYIQSLSSGKFVYLECEDVGKLIDFYESMGFIIFGDRYTDKDERNKFKSRKLIQLIKYLK